MVDKVFWKTRIPLRFVRAIYLDLNYLDHKLSVHEADSALLRVLMVRCI